MQKQALPQVQKEPKHSPMHGSHPAQGQTQPQMEQVPAHGLPQGLQRVQLPGAQKLPQAVPHR
jgi:hypothetical protein